MAKRNSRYLSLFCRREGAPLKAFEIEINQFQGPKRPSIIHFGAYLLRYLLTNHLLGKSSSTKKYHNKKCSKLSKFVFQILMLPIFWNWPSYSKKKKKNCLAVIFKSGLAFHKPLAKFARLIITICYIFKEIETRPKFS